MILLLVVGVILRFNPLKRVFFSAAFQAMLTRLSYFCFNPLKRVFFSAARYC